jgi:hypothetical protein
MNLRHASALAFCSRILAAILAAIPMAVLSHRADLRTADAILSHPQWATHHAQTLQSIPLSSQVLVWSLFGVQYIVVVEVLSWCIRKVAIHATAEFRSDSLPS